MGGGGGGGGRGGGKNKNKMGDGQRGGCIKCMKIRFLQGSYAE